MPTGVRVVAEADMLALIGELTMLRGVVGSLVEAFGFSAGTAQGISADDLEELLVRHGVLRRVDERTCFMAPVMWACLEEARIRNARLPS